MVSTATLATVGINISQHLFGAAAAAAALPVHRRYNILSLSNSGASLVDLFWRIKIQGELRRRGRA